MDKNNLKGDENMNENKPPEWLHWSFLDPENDLEDTTEEIKDAVATYDGTLMVLVFGDWITFYPTTVTVEEATADWKAYMKALEEENKQDESE